jgi:hypothetical protein
LVSRFDRFTLGESVENLTRFFWQVNTLRGTTKNYLGPFRREIIEQVKEVENFGNSISEFKKDMVHKLQTYSRMNYVFKRNFGKQMTTQIKLRIHNTTSKATLIYESDMWVLNKRGNQCLEAAQMKFLRPLLGFIILDHQRTSDISKNYKLKKWNTYVIIKKIKKNADIMARHIGSLPHRVSSKSVP